MQQTTPQATTKATTVKPIVKKPTGGVRLHTGITPSKTLNPQVTAANPLLSKNTYQLHVYDHEASAPTNTKFFHPRHMHKENWIPGGSIVFHGDGKSLTVAGHNIPQARWFPAKSLIAWRAQPGAIPHGSLSFADHKVSALGGIFDTSGQEVTVAGTSLAAYTTKRYKAGTAKDTAVDFVVFTFGAQPPYTGGPIETVDFMDFDPGQNPNLPNGGQDDISTECAINPQTGFGDPFIINKVFSTQHQYSFNITFDYALSTFSGSYVEGIYKTQYNWFGDLKLNPSQQQFKVSPIFETHPIFGQQFTDVKPIVDSVTSPQAVTPAPAPVASKPIAATPVVTAPAPAAPATAAPKTTVPATAPPTTAPAPAPATGPAAPPATKTPTTAAPVTPASAPAPAPPVPTPAAPKPELASPTPSDKPTPAVASPAAADPAAVAPAAAPVKAPAPATPASTTPAPPTPAAPAAPATPATTSSKIIDKSLTTSAPVALDVTDTPTLQDLLHVSSVTIVTTSDNQEIVQDTAQESANDVFQRILLGSVPQDTQNSLFPNLTAMTPDEVAIQQKNQAFYNVAGVPYLAQYIANSDSVSQDIKQHIDQDRIALFWKAVASFVAPVGAPDPVVQFGWDRNSQSFKDIQAAYTQQNMDTYQLGYKLGVPAFVPYLNDPKNWHDQLSAYLTTPEFLARWATQNATAGYTDGHRQLYEWQTQLTCLQSAATALGLQTAQDTQSVISQLAAAMLVPSFDSVNWTDEMKQDFEQQVNNIMAYTQDDLDKIMQENLDEYNEVMAIKAGISLYGSVNDFINSTDAAFRTIQQWYLSKYNLSLNASDLNQIQEQYRNAFIVAGDDISSEAFIQTVGDGYIEEVAQGLQPQAAIWRQWAASAQKIGTTIVAGMTPLLYAAGVGAIIYALVEDSSQLSALTIVQLTGIALELSIKALSALAATKLGVWLQDNLLDRNGITKTLGQWFTEDGVAVVDDTSVLAKLLGASSAEFLVNRLGPALSLIAVGVSIESLVTAIKDGTTTDVIYASINVALAVINTAVVFVGIAATTAEVGSTLALAGAWAGPIGLAIAVIGVVVAIISLFVHDQPSVDNPPEDFVDGPVKDDGYYK